MDRKIEMMKIIVSDEFNLLKDKNQSIEDYQKEKKKLEMPEKEKKGVMMEEYTEKPHLHIEFFLELIVILFFQMN